MSSWRMFLVAAILVFGVSTAMAEEGSESVQESGQGGFLQGLTNVLGTAAKEGLQEAMDQWLGTYEGRIGRVDLVDRRGNALVLEVTYEKVKRQDGVYVDGRVLEGGFPLEGFETTLTPIRDKSGRVRLTIRKSGGGNAGWNGSADTEVESDQIELFLVRQGHEDRPFGNLTYNLAKIWSDSEEEDVPEDLEVGGDTIALAEGETAEGGGQAPTRPFLVPGTVLTPVQAAKPATTPATGSAGGAVAPAPAVSAAGLAAVKVSAYDFCANAAKAEWRGSVGPLSFPGRPDDDKGFVRCLASGRINPNNAARHILQTHPTWRSAGRISGLYPAVVLDDNVRFLATGAFLKGARDSDGATFVVRVLEDGRYRTVLRQKVDPQGYVPLEADLSAWAGKKVRILLAVLAGKSSSQDWAVWVKPRLVKAGS